MFGRLREWYEQTIRPVGGVLVRMHLSPNLLTVLSVLVALLAAYWYAQHRATEGALFIIMSAFVDMLDGAAARASGRVTRFGATFDHVLDRYAEFLIILGMVFGNYVGWVFGFFSLFGMLMASFTRAKAESVGGLQSCTVGIAERQEKLLLLIGGSLLSSYYPPALEYAVIAVGVLSHITVVQRLYYTWVRTGGK